MGYLEKGNNSMNLGSSITWKLSLDLVSDLRHEFGEN